MNGMNPFLAELYGTAETIGSTNSSDTEKLAQAQAMSEMLAGEGIDIDNLSADTIAKVASAIFGDEAELSKAAQEVAEEEKKEEPKPEGEETKESQGDETPAEEKPAEEEKKEEESAEQKTAEADFLGRMMAHAYVNELAEIEKQAAMPPQLAKALGKGKEIAGKALGAVKGAPAKAKEFGKGRVAGYKEVPSELRKVITGKGPKVQGARGAVSRLEALKSVGKKVGPEAVLLAGTGGATAYGLKKKGSALVDTLAQQQVEAILEANSDEAKLASAVDERTVEILRELGYEI